MSRLEFRDVNVHLGSGSKKFHAVKNINLDIPSGSVVGLVGESGSGKSTLAALLARTLDPQSGTVTLGEAMWLSSREVCLALEGEMVMLMLRPVLRYASRKVMSGMSRCISRFTACMSMLFLLPKPILMLSSVTASSPREGKTRSM